MSDLRAVRTTAGRQFLADVRVSDDLRAVREAVRDLHDYRPSAKHDRFGDPGRCAFGGCRDTDAEHVNRRSMLRLLDAALAPPEPAPAPHPNANHEFRTTCLRCGEPGFLHVSLITPNEVVTVHDRPAALTEPIE